MLIYEYFNRDIKSRNLRHYPMSSLVSKNLVCSIDPDHFEGALWQSSEGVNRPEEVSMARYM